VNHRAHRLLGLLVALLTFLAACSSDSGDRSEGGSSGGGFFGGLTTDSSGGSDDDEIPVSTYDVDEPGDWTLLVYIAADNDLEPFALQDLSEMSAARGLDLVVLIDRHPGYTSAPAGDLGNFEDTKVLHIRDGVTRVIDEPGELDTGDPDVLADFVADGLTRFASDRNGLVIWNHGASWPGAAVDETSGDTLLDLVGIREAVADGLARAGIDRLDLIGFDACLMATYEVAANVAPVAHTLLASEELEPGHGWNWTAMHVPEDGLSTRDLGSGLADGFLAQAVELRTSGITLSLIDLNRLPVLEAAFAELTEAVQADPARLVGRLGQSRNDSLGFGRHPDPRYDSHMVDLGHLGRRISDIPGLADAGARLEAAIDELVLHDVKDLSMGSASGLSAYFPPVQDLGRPAYQRVERISPWLDFLGTYYTSAQNVPSASLPAFLDEDRYLEESDVVWTRDSLRIDAPVLPGTGEYVSSAKLFFGQVDLNDTNLVAFYGESVAFVDGDTISAEYDWRYLVLEDGEDESPAYAQIHRDQSGTIRSIVVPGIYHRGDESVDAVLALGIENGSVTTEAFFVYGESGIVAEISHADGDLFMPTLLLQDLTDFSTSWVDAAPVPLWADPDLLDYHLRRLELATPVMLELMLTDVDGGRDFVFHGTASP
jgi:hypothetical protein